MSQVVYYYQTFVGLKDLIQNPEIVDTIIVSSIHFGLNDDHTPYIHLNDLPPNDPKFNDMWKEVAGLKLNHGKEILLMLGGAGGAYQELFEDYDTYYNMLRETIKERPYITGIDLDIEEYVKIQDIKDLVIDLIRDFGVDFKITFAPLSSSLQYDEPGMGGFSYKELYNSEIGKYISSFHVQAYGSFSFETFDRMVKNGYPENKLIIGMLSGMFNKDTFHLALAEVDKIKVQYPNMGGVFDWEYLDAPPNSNSPGEWANDMSKIVHSTPTFLYGMYVYLLRSLGFY